MAGTFHAVKWLFFRNASRQVTAFVFTLFMSRILSVDDFGMVGIIYVFIELSNLFMDMGLGGALIQKREIQEEDYSTVFYMNVVFGALLTLIFYMSAGFFAHFFKIPMLEDITKVLSVIFIINSLTIVQSTRQTKEINFSFKTKVSFISDLIGSAVALSMALYGFGVWSLVFKGIVASVVMAASYWVLIRWRPLWYFNIKRLKSLWGFGFKMFISNVIEIIYARMDIVLLGKLSTPAQLGLYFRAKSLNELATRYTVGSVSGAFYPLLCKVNHDLALFRNTVLKYYRIVSFGIFPMIGILYFVADELLVFLYSDKWIGASHYFQILAIVGPVYPLSLIVVNAISARGNASLFLRLEIIKKIILTIAIPIGIIYGFYFYLYTYVLLCYICLGLNILYLHKDCPPITIPDQLKNTIPYLMYMLMALLPVMLMAYLFHIPGYVKLFVLPGVVLVLYWYLNKLVKSPAHADIKIFLAEKKWLPLRWQAIV
ncbi:MAG: lipopolysaccharide biosynthesis protein [Chitinophagaceae bacterium]|nr:lipopolysaccharide biosynthesis protein [Chitinophagaceae bacterium]